ncbi:hypothetical protein [Actinophytocola sp. KF-1]
MHATSVTDHDVTRPSRRHLLVGMTMLSGATLVHELQPLLWPVARQTAEPGSAFSPVELQTAEQLVQVLRSWHSTHGALSR